MHIEDDNLFLFMQDVRGSLGRIEERQSNTVDHLKAVNVKLNGHIADPDAHGAGGERRATRTILGLIGLLVSIIGVTIAFARFYN